MGLFSEAHLSGLLMPGQNERFHSDNQLGMETTRKKLWCSEMIRKHNLIEVAVSLSLEVEASSRKGGKILGFSLFWLGCLARVLTSLRHDFFIYSVKGLSQITPSVTQLSVRLVCLCCGWEVTERGQPLLLFHFSLFLKLLVLGNSTPLESQINLSLQ